MNRATARRVRRYDGGCWVVPPTGRSDRLFRFYDRLDTAWTVAPLVPIFVCLGLMTADPTVVTSPAWAWAVVLSCGGFAADYWFRIVWRKSAFRVLAYYYREWLEEADSPGFCALALRDHAAAVVLILGTFAVTAAGCLVAAVGLYLLLAYHRPVEGWGSFLCGFSAVMAASFLSLRAARTTGERGGQP